MDIGRLTESPLPDRRYLRKFNRLRYTTDIGCGIAGGPAPGELEGLALAGMMIGAEERKAVGMDAKRYYLREVYPRLDLPLAEEYPLVSLIGGAGFHGLGQHDVRMLVALTGAGKSTALNILRKEPGDIGAARIPSRREVADWIAIPLAQHWAGEPLMPAPDRVKRFALTRFFAERVEGGMAAAFSWLNIADSYDGLILAEGIRGPNEIRYGLARFPRWQIVELALDPLTRLRRLSGRRDEFDRAAGAADVSFLSLALQAEAKRLVAAGEISETALRIIRAEAANYGLYAFADGAAYPNYHRLDVAGAAPGEVAAALLRLVERQRNG